jgi:hypothetical protein
MCAYGNSRLFDKSRHDGEGHKRNKKTRFDWVSADVALCRRESRWLFDGVQLVDLKRSCSSLADDKELFMSRMGCVPWLCGNAELCERKERFRANT